MKSKMLIIWLIDAAFFFAGYYIGKPSVKHETREERVMHVVYKHNLYVIGEHNIEDLVMTNLTWLEAKNPDQVATWYFHTNHTNLSLEQ